MKSAFDVWAPMFRAPFSGDVTQEIIPHLFSQEIKGIPEVEYKVQTEVASYGRQLGKILDALEALSAATNTPLPEIDTLVAEVDAIKAKTKDAIHDDAKAALKRLRDVDEERWREVLEAR